MESKNELKGTQDFEIKYFKVSYAVIWVIIIALNAVILPLIIFQLLNFIPIFQSSVAILRFAYYLFIISPIVKIGFEVYEIIRFILFLKSDKKDKEGASKVARGFIGTRIFRNYYLVVILVLMGIAEIFDFMAKVVGFPGSSAFLAFYFWFMILVFIDVFFIGAGPHLIKLSMDYKNKEKQTKALVWSIVWIVALIIIFNIDYLIPFFI